MGQVSENFEWRTLDGDTVSLESKCKEGPVVVVVLRGFPGYQCPLCTRQVGALIKRALDFEKHNTSVILIYPGSAKGLDSKAKDFIKKTELPRNFFFVTDPDYRYVEANGLRWNASNETAYPSTFVFDRDRKVIFEKISKEHGDRSEPNHILDAITKSTIR
jgi:peroxiredoxin